MGSSMIDWQSFMIVCGVASIFWFLTLVDAGEKCLRDMERNMEIDYCPFEVKRLKDQRAEFLHTRKLSLLCLFDSIIWWFAI